MAQYSTNFADSGYGTGSQPPDWTARWGAVDSPEDALFTVESDSSGFSFGDQVLQIDYISSAYSALSWDDAGVSGDFDTKIRVRWMAENVLSYGTGLVLRGSGTEDDETGYVVAGYPYNDEILLWKIDGGAKSDLGSCKVPQGLVVGKWYWIRFQVTGTNLKVKVWRDDEGEPASWDIEETDATIGGTGWVGVFVRKDDGEVDWFGAGTGGSVPPSPPSAEGDARVTQIVTEVLRQFSSTQVSATVVVVN